MVRQNQRVCFICGAGHSGSTLIGLVLGSHPECFYAGEGGKTRFLHDEGKDLRKRVCKLCGPSCPVWGDFVVEDAPDLYEQIARRTSRSVIIDSTKDLDWIGDHTRTLVDAGVEPHLLYLQRDGRAVINSRVRKYPDRYPVQQIDQWLDQIQKTTDFYDAYPGQKTILHYEAFATDPAASARQLCQFLSIDYHPGMIRFFEFDHHPLGGNNGTQYLVARHQGPNLERPYNTLGDRSRSYYERHENGIKLDLRWTTELKAEVLELFERRAGEVNDPFRWEDDQT